MQVFFPLGIDDTDEHRVGMQVDPAVELVLLLIKFHHASPGLEARRFQLRAFSPWPNHQPQTNFQAST
jgi:hypothetical protein